MALVGPREVTDDHVGVVRGGEGDQVERAVRMSARRAVTVTKPSFSRVERTASITSARELKIATSGRERRRADSGTARTTMVPSDAGVKATPAR